MLEITVLSYSPVTDMLDKPQFVYIIFDYLGCFLLLLLRFLFFCFNFKFHLVVSRKQNLTRSQITECFITMKYNKASEFGKCLIELCPKLESELIGIA